MNLFPMLQALEQLDHHKPTFAIQPEREAAFLKLGAFLETHIRSGQPFDFTSMQPNPVWQMLEERLSNAIADLNDHRPGAGQWRIHQLYGSGILLDTGTQRLGFDLVPLRRLYGWEDRFDMTHRLAKLIDVLFITHRHEDHYDEEMIRACLQAGKPVYLPESLARKWKPNPLLNGLGAEAEWDLGDLHVHSRAGVHVWRKDLHDVPLCVYELSWPDRNAFIFGGDVDYTKQLTCAPDLKVLAFFLPWRAPNALYEAGDERQTGTLAEAAQIALDQLHPQHLFYNHCAELEHVVDGFSASYDLALDLKHHLPVKSELLFWGEHLDIPAQS